MIGIRRRRLTRVVPVAVALAMSALLAGTGPAGSALAAVRSPEGWVTQTQVPDASTSLPPAEATDGATWYVAWTTAAGGIDYVIRTTSWWPKVRTVSGKDVTPATDTAPAMAIFHRHLYVFWINSSGQIRYADLVGTSWKPARTLSGSWGKATSSATPAVTVSGSGSTSTLWVAWKGLTNDNIDISWAILGSSPFGARHTAVKDATTYSPSIVGYDTGD